MTKALHFLQITAKQQYCPFFTVFLTIKTSSQNISITLLQISLKLHVAKCRRFLNVCVLEIYVSSSKMNSNFHESPVAQ